MDYQVNQSGFSNHEKKSEITDIVRTQNAQTEQKPSIDKKAYQLDIASDELKGKKVKGKDSDSEDIVRDKKMATLKLLESMLSKLRGKDVKLDRSFLDLEIGGKNGAQGKPIEGKRNNGLRINNQLNNMNIEFTHREVYEEKQEISFSSVGSVTTSDGRSIDFKLDFNMVRQTRQEFVLNINTGQKQKQIDPLVVAFGASAPSLSQMKHDFDLDSDGKTESISMPTSGSGFLAYDKNGNGVIDDGSELFGPQNGDGFEALRVYDSDNNGWIDEADDVFSKLSILTTDGADKTLFKITDVGIGAIYLNAVDTEFDMVSGGDNQGTMKNSSVFLREDGTAGTLHHMDITV